MGLNIYESVCLILAEAFLIMLGIFNFRGNISSIHWYQRTRVSEENQTLYGECMEIGIGVIGITSIFTWFCNFYLNVKKISTLFL